MSIGEAKQLKVGDKVIHSGVWAAHIGKESLYTVVTTDDDCIRVQSRGYVSLYSWHGCSDFETVDFFASCATQ